MLRIWFGDRKDVIMNSSVYFRNTYKDAWITDEFAKKVIKDIDKSEVIDAQNIQSPVLGGISPEKLSSGVKTLILMKHNPGKVFNASNCGDNCAKWILDIAREKDFTIALFHVMDFGNDPFEIRVLNAPKLKVYTMRELLDAGVKYLREDLK